MKSKGKYLFLFIIFYVLCFGYSYFISCVYSDEIWNYGVAYNISLGMVPYRDFNLVTTPLYPMLASIFIKVFGHHLYSFHLFNSLILALTLVLIYYKLGRKGFILFPFILLNGYPGYNILSVFLVILLLSILDLDFKNKDIILGLFVSFMFLTKQTIGICLFIPMIYYSKEKIKSFISFMIPIIIFLIYLLWNNALYEFINYCFLGLFDFGESNGILLFLPILIIICLIILYFLIKNRFKNEKLFYILMFQVIAIPIVDDYHFMLGLIPILYYCLLCCEIESYKLKYYFIISLFICCLWIFYVHNYELGHLYSDKNSYLYGRNIPSYVEDSVTIISDYINVVKDDYDYIYFFSANAYYVKMNAGYRLTKYDMICNGNMGYHGSIHYFEEINDYCDSHSCMFILYKYEFREDNVSQTNLDLVNYVKDNYNRFEEVDVFDIYIN